jgi:hypothetical protein
MSTNNTSNSNPWLPTNKIFHQHSLAQIIRAQKKRMLLVHPNTSNTFRSNNTQDAPPFIPTTNLPGPAGTTRQPSSAMQDSAHQQDPIFKRKPWEYICCYINTKYRNVQLGTNTPVQQLLALHSLAIYKKDEYRPRAIQLLGVVTNLKSSHAGFITTATLKDPSSSINAELDVKAVKKYGISEGSALLLRDVALYNDSKAPNIQDRTKHFAIVTTLNVVKAYHEP